MSKSKGNSYILQDIEKKGYSPMDLRMIFLSAHYRSHMDFTWEGLEQAKKNKETLFAVIERLEGSMDSTIRSSAVTFHDDTLQQIRIAVQDDLNTPGALAMALLYAKEINTKLDQVGIKNQKQLLETWERIFFLFGLTPEKETIPEDVETLAKEREAARVAKNFAESDRLRDLIEKRGYRTEDTPSGYRLKKA